MRWAVLLLFQFPNVMPEPWEEALEVRERAREEREQRERQEEGKRREAQELRERERDKRGEEREDREREREERGERREEEREKREQNEKKGEFSEREAERRNLPPSIPSFAFGGGPSFLLSVPDSALNFSSQTENILAGGSKSAYVAYSSIIPIMGNNVVAPGSIWAISGGYIKLPLFVNASGNIKFSTIKNPGGYTSLTISILRGASAIYHGNDTGALLFNTISVTNLWAVSNLSIGIEFPSPVVLGAGETIQLELQAETHMNWSETPEGEIEGVLQMNTGTNRLNPIPIPPFMALGRNGSIRYNVESIR